MEREDYDPSVGIMATYWFCTECDHSELAEYDQGDD
jgi:hypothetical protein